MPNTCLGETVSRWELPGGNSASLGGRASLASKWVGQFFVQFPCEVVGASSDSVASSPERARVNPRTQNSSYCSSFDHWNRRPTQRGFGVPCGCAERSARLPRFIGSPDIPRLLKCLRWMVPASDVPVDRTTKGVLSPPGGQVSAWSTNSKFQHVML